VIFMRSEMLKAKPPTDLHQREARFPTCTRYTGQRLCDLGKNFALTHLVAKHKTAFAISVSHPYRSAGTDEKARKPLPVR
jgi:hypothetical protein